jgi:hypothetical protein
MKIKTITYQRVLNLGNYESKRLEMTAEIPEGDDVESATSSLMELVERKIREDSEQEIRRTIRELKNQLLKLNEEIAAKKLEAYPDDIPFDQRDSGIPDGF